MRALNQDFARTASYREDGDRDRSADRDREADRIRQNDRPRDFERVREPDQYSDRSAPDRQRS
jgi:hypothetical protein